jgi:hypothetical protein
MVECIFGWGKQHGTMRKTKHRGIARVAGDFLLNLIAQRGGARRGPVILSRLGRRWLRAGLFEKIGVQAE